MTEGQKYCQWWFKPDKRAAGAHHVPAAHLSSSYIFVHVKDS